MKPAKKQTGPSRDWLQRQAEAEEKYSSMSVGGPVSDLGMLKPPQEVEISAKTVLARLVELARRSRWMSRQDLAQSAEVGLDDVASIEQCEDRELEPRTVHKLALVLKLPESPLMELAGLVHCHGERLGAAAVRFAALSRCADLSKEEQRALREFVKTLSELSTGE